MLLLDVKNLIIIIINNNNDNNLRYNNNNYKYNNNNFSRRFFIPFSVCFSIDSIKSDFKKGEGRI